MIRRNCHEKMKGTLFDLVARFREMTVRSENNLKG